MYGPGQQICFISLTCCALPADYFHQLLDDFGDMELADDAMGADAADAYDEEM